MSAQSRQLCASLVCFENPPPSPFLPPMFRFSARPNCHLSLSPRGRDLDVGQPQDVPAERNARQAHPQADHPSQSENRVEGFYATYKNVRPCYRNEAPLPARAYSCLSEIPMVYAEAGGATNACTRADHSTFGRLVVSTNHTFMISTLLHRR